MCRVLAYRRRVVDDDATLEKTQLFRSSPRRVASSSSLVRGKSFECEIAEERGGICDARHVAKHTVELGGTILQWKSEEFDML